WFVESKWSDCAARVIGAIGLWTNGVLRLICVSSDRPLPEGHAGIAPLSSRRAKRVPIRMPTNNRCRKDLGYVLPRFGWQLLQSVFGWQLLQSVQMPEIPLFFPKASGSWAFSCSGPER